MYICPACPVLAFIALLERVYSPFFAVVTLLARFCLLFLRRMPSSGTNVICLHALDRRFTALTLFCTLRHPPCPICNCSFLGCAGALQWNPILPTPPIRPPITATILSDACIANLRLGAPSASRSSATHMPQSQHAAPRRRVIINPIIINPPSAFTSSCHPPHLDVLPVVT